MSKVLIFPTYIESSNRNPITRAGGRLELCGLSRTYNVQSRHCVSALVGEALRPMCILDWRFSGLLCQSERDGEEKIPDIVNNQFLAI
jgi:hypothetical protein